MNQLSTSCNLGNGFNWVVQQWPYAVQGLFGQVNIIGLRSNISYQFQETDGVYVSSWPLNRQTLELDTNDQVLRFTDRDGSMSEFDELSGMFVRRFTPGGEMIEVKEWSSNGYNPAEVERSVEQDGDTITEQFLYDYDSISQDLVLSTLTLRRKVNSGSWRTCNASSTLITLMATHSARTRNLETATTQEWTGSDWQDTGTSYYRYYLADDGSSSSSSSSSRASSWPPHLLKYALNAAAFQRLKDDPSVTDPLTASDAIVALYADHYFEYDEDRRVTKEIVQGGSQTFLFAYEESGFDDGYNSWKVKTTETLPDGSQNIVFTNYAGQTMLQVFKSGTDEWLQFSRYDEDGYHILQANPSAVTGYDEELSDLLDYDSGTDEFEYLRGDEGLIHTYAYDVCSGYISRESVQEGQLGTPIKLKEYEYVGCQSSSGGSSSSSSSSSSSGCPQDAVWFTRRRSSILPTPIRTNN